MNNSIALARNEITYNPHLGSPHVAKQGRRTGATGTALSGFEQVFVPHGSSLACQGDIIDCAFYILSGWVLEEEVTCDGEVAWADIVLRGEVAGLNCVTSECGSHKEVTTASITAITDVFAVRVPRSKLDPQEQGNSPLTQMIHETLRRQAAHLHEHLVALSAKNANDRVILMLKSLKHRSSIAFGATDAARLPISQVVLARIANISVVHMNRIAQKLRQDGILDWSPEGVRLAA